VGKIDRTPLQQWSKVTLGHDHRLGVSVAMMESDEFQDLETIMVAACASRTATFHDLEFLTTIGAVQKVQGSRNAFQRIPDHPFWAFAQSLLAVAPESRPRVGGR
jgi:hypothetical protein